MTALTDDAENFTLDWLTGKTTTAPVLPLKVALVTAVAGTPESTAGTEVTNSAGSTYARQNVVFTTSASGQASNNAVVRFDNMPNISAPGVVGFEVWDSATTPKRWWYAPLTTARTYAAGDAAEFPAGQLVLAID